MKRDLPLALGILLSTATQLRPTGAPLGPGEAHNTLLDIFTQGGLLAVLGLVWLVATAFLVTFRAKLDGLTTLLCGLIVFTIFHLIVRHPIFWLAIAMCLVAAESRQLSLARARS